MAVVLRFVLCLTAWLFMTSRVESKPFFDNWFCDLMCDDDDIYDDSSTSTTTSFENLFESMIDCSGCPTSRPRSTTTTTSSPMSNQGFNLNFPPSPVGMNFTILNTGTSWLMNLLPYLPGATPMPPPVAPAPAASPAAPTPPAAAPAADNATATEAPAA